MAKLGHLKRLTHGGEFEFTNGVEGVARRGIPGPQETSLFMASPCGQSEHKFSHLSTPVDPCNMDISTTMQDFFVQSYTILHTPLTVLRDKFFRLPHVQCVANLSFKARNRLGVPKI